MKSRVIILIIFVLNFSVMYCQAKENYAKYLISNEDYFRAISEFKELYFFSNDSSVKLNSLYNITRAYYLGEKFGLSNSYADHLLDNYRLDKKMQAKLYLYRGLNYYNLLLPEVAEDCFIKSNVVDKNLLSKFYLGMIEIEKSNWQKAYKIYWEVANNSANQELSFLSNHLAEKCLEFPKINSKSPLLASVFSAIIPGCGQVYSGHFYDGLQALLYCTITSFAAYSSYRYDKNFNSNYVTTYVAVPVAAIFYLANVLGANITAKYFNMKQKQNYFNSFREIALNQRID